MLTAKEKAQTAKELMMNYARLDREEAQVLADLQFTPAQLTDALAVAQDHVATPEDIWKLRDYLEEELSKAKQPIVPFSVLQPGRNHWYSYQKTWSD